jgi:hypothetical protein
VAVVISLAGVLTDRERGHVGIALIRPAALTLGRIGHYLRDALVASPANEYNGRRHGSREGKEDFFFCFEIALSNQNLIKKLAS